jgi:hypothetical protein
LGDGRKANLLRSGKSEEEATIDGAAFLADVKKFLQDEPPNPHLEITPTSEELQLHLTHCDEVINTIVTAMFKPAKPGSQFTYHTVEQSVRYFAQMAAKEVQRLIESPEQRAVREKGLEIVSIEEHEEEGHEVSDEAALPFPHPESVIEQVDYQRHIQRKLKPNGDKWLALFLMCEKGGYTWNETALSLQGKAPADGWACAGQEGATQPRNPAEVWNDLKSGYTLPGWNTVRGWFPPPPPNAGSLRVFYCRGEQRLRRAVVLNG